MRRLLVPALIALALLGLWWLLGTDEGDSDEVGTERPRDGTDAAQPDGPATLGVHGSASARTDREGASAQPAAAATPQNDCTWTLELRCVRRRGRAGYAPGWEEAKPDPSFAGKRVRVELRRGQARTTLATIALGKDGRASVPLPQLRMLDALARVSSRLHVLPAEDDFERLPPPRSDQYRIDTSHGIHSMALPASLPGKEVTLRLLVQAIHGGLVRGRVENRQREPVADAHVWLYGHDGAEATDTCTNADGRFAVGVSKGGRFNFYVTAQNGATAVRPELDLRAGVAQDLGVLTVEGEHAFGGRISYEDGSPVVGLPVAGDVHNMDMHLSMSWPSLGCQRHHSGCGTRTDADGRYCLYMEMPVKDHLICSIRFQTPGDARVHMRKEDAAFPSKPRLDLDGTLRGCRVDVRVVDQHGLPVHDTRVEFRRKRPGGAVARKRTETLDTDLEGRTTLWLTPGSRWEVATVLPGASPGRAEFTVPKKVNRAPLEIALQPLPTDTALQLTLRDPDGKTLAPVVWTIQTSTGSELFSRRVDTPALLRRLPGGRYRVRARSIDDGRVARLTSRWLEVDQQVDVEAGKTNKVDLTTHPSAHLKVVLRMAAGVEKDAAPHHPAAVLEHTETGRKVDCYLDRPWSGSSETTLSENLEPGQWVVRLKASGFKSVTRKVKLVAGELGSVEFVLEPE